jgi:hypothetical protein
MFVGGVRWRDQGHGSKAVDRGHRSVHFLGRSAPGKGNTPTLESGGGVQGEFLYICRVITGPGSLPSRSP